MDSVRAFFPKIRTFFLILKKEQGRSLPSPLPFLENQKMSPDFGKKDPDSIHLWVKFSIRNVVSKVSRGNTPKIFPAGPFFLVYVMKCLLTCLIPRWDQQGCIRNGDDVNDEYDEYKLAHTYM